MGRYQYHTHSTTKSTKHIAKRLGIPMINGTARRLDGEALDSQEKTSARPKAVRSNGQSNIPTNSKF